MQLHSDVQIPDGLLSSMTLLNEKPHQGVPIWNLALHQGIDERNSTAAIGLRASAQLNRIWPRYTGKERDTESGLDYFGARYYASSMGRWMSPDWADKPEAVPYSDLSNPQSLNLYGYVSNNPLSKDDPNGHDPSDLTYDGQAHTITLTSSDGKTVGSWPAANNVAIHAPAPNYDSTIPSYCKAAVLGAVNSQFGTNFANANIQSSFMNGGGANLVITASGLSAAQFNGLQTGRYASGFLNAITGVGPSLHIAGYSAVNDPNAIFNNSNIGGMTSVTFTAHTDSAFANNPFGALLHYILDVSKHGKATRNPCP